MIVGIIGTWDTRINGEMIKGNGKTLTMTYYLYKDYKLGRRVYCNHFTNFTDETDTRKVYELFKDTSVQNVSIGIDEIQMDINSIGSDPLLIKEFCNKAAAQTRKKDVDFYWTAQRAKDVHLRLRVQTDVFLQPIRIHADRTRCGLLGCTRPHYIAVMSLEPRKARPIVYLDCAKVGELYDTNQVMIDEMVAGN